MHSLFDSLWKDEDVIVTYGIMTVECIIDVDCQGPGPKASGSTWECGGTVLRADGTACSDPIG